MIAPTVGTSTAPETNTVSAKLGFDAGMRHAAVAGADAGAKEAVAGAGKVFLDMAGAAAIEGAEAGVKRFEPTILLSVGACILTAAFFVPPTAASGAEVVVGFVGLYFMCDGFIGKNGAEAGVKRFEPTILLSVGACILTAAFFVPPTAASGAEVVVGFVGLCFMCDGFIGKNALRAKDAAKDAAAKDAAEAAAKDAAEATAKDATEAAANNAILGE